MFPGAAFDAKEQIRQAVSIVDVVGASVELRPQGRNFVGICPWHDDSRPSMQVNPERQSWKCWVCDIGGDIFSFVMQRDGVDFRQALEMLAETAGISLGKSSGGPIPEGPNNKQTLFQAMAWAREQFHTALIQEPAAEAARMYLDERGINQLSIEKFQIGYAPDQWQWLIDRARATSFSTATLLAAGLIGESAGGKYYDRFKGRLMFPISDVQQRPIAFGGRILPGAAEAENSAGNKAAKYINSPETRLFSKSQQLYALDLARNAIVKERRLVVVEGYTDVIIAHQYGFANHVAVLGTALGPRHVALLRRYADQIVLVLDGDDAGQRRTNDILDLFVAQNVDLRVLALPEGLDPCDCLLERGETAYQELLATSVDAIEHKIRTARGDINVLQDTHGAHHALEEILLTLAKAPTQQGGAKASIKLREEQVLMRLSREFGVEKTELISRLRELRRSSRRIHSGTGVHSAAGAHSKTGVHSETGEVSRTSLVLSSWEREFWEILSLRPELADEAIPAVAADDLPSDCSRLLLAAYAALHVRGESVAFERVMTEVDDPQLKNLLVDIDESARAKESLALKVAPLRLQQLLHEMQQQRADQQLHRKAVQIGQKHIDEEEQLKILMELQHRGRERYAQYKKE